MEKKDTEQGQDEEDQEAGEEEDTQITQISIHKMVQDSDWIFCIIFLDIDSHVVLVLKYQTSLYLWIGEPAEHFFCYIYLFIYLFIYSSMHVFINFSVA